MTLRSGGMGAACVLVSLFFSGCATSKLDSVPPTFPGEAMEPEVERRGQAGPGSEAEPGWRRIAYRGKIEWSGIGGGPIPGAVVSICDGDEVYHSTLTEEDGTFELPVDLYGILEGGKWTPETYYVLLVRAPSGEWTKQRLRELETGRPLNVQLERTGS